MERRRCSHFFLFPFFFFLLFLDFLRPPGITGLIAGGLVGDGAAADGASAAGAGTSAVLVASALVPSPRARALTPPRRSPGL